MLFPRLSAFSALLFTLVFFASAHASVVPLARKDIELARSPSDAWTNAQRLAVGLPPLAPRRLKRAPTPTEPGVAKRAAPSPSPSSNAFSSTRVTKKTYTGTLQARTVSNNATLGFVRLSSSGVELGSDGTPVTFTAVGSAPFSIATVTADDNEVPSFLGAVGTSAIAAGTSATLGIKSVIQSQPHARPSLTGSESAIWTIDANSLKLSPLWVNPDGSHVRTTLAYSTSSGSDSAPLFLTGDVSAYNAAHADAPASEVALYLVSL